MTPLAIRRRSIRDSQAFGRSGTLVDLEKLEGSSSTMNDSMNGVRRGLSVLIAAGLGVGLAASPVAAQCDSGEMTMQELLAQDSQGYEQFGYAVAVSGDVAIVGANEDDDLGMNSGSAYVFRFDGTSWVQEQKLLASDGGPTDMFGVAVDIAGDTAIIGAQKDDDQGNNAGAAYVFRFDGSSWVEVQKLVPHDGSAWDAFGSTVAISDDFIMVGALDDDQGYNSGSVYLFAADGDGWQFEDKLMPADGSASALFGNAVDIDGDLAVIGARADYELGTPTGAAYIFRFDGQTWGEEQKLHASDAGVDNLFGSSVAIKGNLAVIGDPNEGSLGNGDPRGFGAAYVFEASGSSWSQVAKLEDVAGELQDFFGESVAIDDGKVVVGAPGDDDNGIQSGSVFVFQRTGGTWSLDAQLVAEDADGIYNFGHSVARFGDQAVVGAKSGAAYLVSNGGGAASSAVEGDANGDTIVDVDDLIFVLLNWGPCSATCQGDLNCDEMIAVDDLLLVITNWDDPS